VGTPQRLTAESGGVLQGVLANPRGGLAPIAYTWLAPFRCAG